MIDGIIEWWANFFEHSTFWNAFWPAVWGALIGAVTAFSLERRYRDRERISREVGLSSRLVFTLGQMMSVLEDFNDLLFVDARGRLGREPEWQEIGSLPGAPKTGPEFVIGEYDFLLEDRDTKSRAPQTLGRAYFAASRFNSALALVHERTQLYDQYRVQSASTSFELGEAAVPGIMAAEAIGNRVEQLTGMIADDLPEAIAIFKEVIPELGAMLSARYPGRKFIEMRPKPTK